MLTFAGIPTGNLRRFPPSSAMLTEVRDMYVTTFTITQTMDGRILKKKACCRVFQKAWNVVPYALRNNPGCGTSTAVANKDGMVCFCRQITEAIYEFFATYLTP
eukprot:8671285-Karenia_brevis.AAC.1